MTSTHVLLHGSSPPPTPPQVYGIHHWPFKAGFHYWRSRSWSCRRQSGKRAYDQVKIENRSHKRSHKLNRIWFRRIRMFPFLPIPFTTPSLMIQWRAEAEEQSNHKAQYQALECFIQPLLLATPTLQFSLDHKWRSNKQNQCSVSDSVGLIFTRSYRSVLLTMTPTLTPLLVKNSL